MHSNSTWLEFPGVLFADPYFEESVIGEGIRGIAYTMQNLIPLYIMCDRTDISVIPMVRAPFSNLPTIYIYDRYAGGIGLSKKVYNILPTILEAVLEHIQSCPCENGCPSCIGPPLESGLFGKESAKRIIRELI